MGIILFPFQVGTRRGSEITGKMLNILSLRVDKHFVCLFIDESFKINRAFTSVQGLKY